MQRPMIPHRSAEFSEFYLSLLDRLRKLHRTESEILLWSGSGSAGWEIAMVNLLTRRRQHSRRRHGRLRRPLRRSGDGIRNECPSDRSPLGRSRVSGRLLDAALDEHPEVRAVLLTHNETSTGVTNPLRELAAVARRHNVLVLVDAVSSAGGLPLEVDEWGLDFVLSGSQKAWMCPPGIVLVAAGPRAWEAAQCSSNPRFFWDMQRTREMAASGFTPTTPSLTLLYALDAATRMIETEGIDAVWLRHQRVGELTRAGLAQLGLQLLPEANVASNTVTAFFPPEGISNKTIINRLEKEFGVVVAGRAGSPGQQNHSYRSHGMGRRRRYRSLSGSAERGAGDDTPQVKAKGKGQRAKGKAKGKGNRQSATDSWNHHRPSTIDHRPSTIDHRPSTIDHQPPTINHRPSTTVTSTTNHQPSTINRALRPRDSKFRTTELGPRPTISCTSRCRVT